jgi:hypothetical protein
MTCGFFEVTFCDLNKLLKKSDTRERVILSAAKNLGFTATSDPSLRSG